MPIYDYVCGSCAQRTEVIHGIDAPGPRFCPACGADGTLRKAFVAPTVHFKGSGWAKKDRSTLSRSRSRSDADGGPGEGGDRSATALDGSGSTSTAAGTEPKAGGSGGSDGSVGSSGSGGSSDAGGSGSSGSGSARSASDTGSDKGSRRSTSSKER